MRQNDIDYRREHQAPQRWWGNSVLFTKEFLQEVKVSVSRGDLHLEALHIDEVQSIWTDLWDQAGVGIRTDNKVGSTNRPLQAACSWCRKSLRCNCHFWSAAGGVATMDGKQQLDT